MLLMPECDKWIIHELVLIFSERLCLSGQDSYENRKALLAFICCLQKLPDVPGKTQIGLTFENYFLNLSKEKFEIFYFTDDGHTEYQQTYYLSSEPFLMIGMCTYEIGAPEDERQECIMSRLELLKSSLDENTDIHIETHSIFDLNKLIRLMH